MKLSAFLARYTAGLDRLQASAFVAMWDAWNRGEEPGSADAVKPSLAEAWARFVARRDALTEHASRWAAILATRRDLAAELADFVDNVL